MDTLKGAVTGWKHLDEGREPVSGAQGEGTTAEPFDSGNKQEVTQAADSTQDASEFDSEHAYLGSAIEADQARAADASKSEPAPTSTTNTVEEKPPATEEKKSGGGFLSSLGLGGGSKKKEEEKEAQAGAEKVQEKEEAEAEKPLPPNHLGSAVPEGMSEDLADPGTVAPGQTDGLAAQKSTTTSTEPPTVSEPAPAAVDTTPRSPVTPTSAGKQSDRGGSLSSSGLSPDRSRSTGGSAAPVALPGSRGEGRGSMVPADAPKYKRVENPNRIPIAGGKRIGEEQYQTRRASMAPGSGSPPPPPPAEMRNLDREGSPDPVTAGNTEKNVQPTSPAPAPTTPAPAPAAAAPVEAKNTAPQQMKDFSMGSASAEADSKPAPIAEEGGPGMTDDVAPDMGPNGPVATSTAGGLGATKSASSGKENASGGRRASMFGKLKDKMRL